MTDTTPSTDAHVLDVLIVGAGFSGLYMLHKMRELGFAARIVEAADGVGGAWNWNRYPGCRCDVPSWEYSYSFSPELQQEWVWTERFPAQPEILAYLNHVADRFELRDGIDLGVRVESTRFDEDRGRWAVATDRSGTYDAQFVVMATGGLSVPKNPGIDGFEDFAGEIVFTSRWPCDGVQLEGRRVGVVGTGSSGIQVIPEIAKVADELYVFQRTPQFTVPARNRPLEPGELDEIKSRYAQIRATARQTGFGLAEFEPYGRNALDADDAERQREFDRRWAEGGPSFLVAFDDLIVDERANEFAAAYARERIAEIVDDPAVAEALTPRGYPLGCKRLCNDTDYYATFNRSNVTLVDVAADPIARLTTSGLQTENESYPLDVLVMATGFDALTGALSRIDVRGRDGETLAEAWAEGPATYLGLMVSGFPNMFLMTGPGSPSLLSNMVTSIEQHVEWVAGCLTALRSDDASTIEASLAAQVDWSQHVQEVGGETLFTASSCSSYYRGDNIDGKTRHFLPYAGGVDAYGERLAEVVANGYHGFHVEAGVGA